MTHRALIVAAVSTPSQAADDKASIPRQLDDCRLVCAARHWDIIGEVVIPGHSRNYDDLAELVADCPEYGRIVKAIADSSITLLVAWAYDRLWRTDALRAQVTALCRRHKVQVYAANQPSEPTQDGTSPFVTRASETIFGLFSENENVSRVRRMCSGKEGVIKAGGVQYNDRPPYGYAKAGPRSIAPNPATAPVVVTIYELRVNQRLGFHAIARELNNRAISSPMGNTWKHKAVIDIIRNTVYKGETHWGSARCEDGQHAPLVARDIWDAAQVNLAVYRHTAPFDRPLAGLCRCGYCGYAMCYERPQPRRTKQLRCGHYLAGGECCPNSNRADKIEEFVRDNVIEALLDPEAFLASRQSDARIAEIGAQLNQVEVELAALDVRRQRGWLAYDSGAIPLDEYAQHRKGIERRVAELEQQRHMLSMQDSAIQRLTVSLELYAPLISHLDALPVADLHAVYISLIGHITVTRGSDPVIHWL